MELRALWDVSQQFQNKNGSINASGKVFVYFLGRTALATTYTGEDGNVVNSNPILLDNNGRATCYADTKYSYTIVVCDFYGKELFSYDITLHDAISTVEDVIVLGSDGTVLVDETQLPNGVQYDLSVNTDIFATNADLQSTSAILQEEIDQNSTDISAISSVLPDKKDKQSELVFGGNDHMTITRIRQNENGEITEVQYEPIDLPPQVPNVEIISPSGTVNVTSVTDTETNTKTFELDVNQRDPFWHYWTGNNAWTKIYNGTWKEINRPAIGAGSSPHTWNPTITKGVWDAKAHFTVTFHNEDENHVIPNDKLQIGFRAKLVGQNNPDRVNYIDLGAYVYDPSLYTTEWYQYNFAQESIRQNFDTSLIMNVANYFGDSAFDVYFEAKLLNTDGGPDPSVTPIDQDICRVEITYFGIHEICNVNGTVTINNVTGSTYGEGWGINILDNVISVDPSVIPEVSGFATETELAEVSANIISQIPESQVQSNWTETDSDDPSFIQNKPEEIELIAGTNVEITTSGNSAIISAIGSGDVTQAELTNVSATLHTEIVNVSANIPEQVQSNWTETDDSDPSFIQNKPEEKSLVAGDNISLAVSGNNVVISSTASGDVMMSDLVNVSANLQTEIINVSSTLQTEINNVTANLPEQVQSNWTEDDTEDPSYIQNKPEELLLVAGNNVEITTSGNSAIISSTASGGSTYTAGDGIDITNDVISVDGTIARKTELTTVSGNLHTEIQAVSAAIPIVTPQVQSNWTEDDDSDPSYIQNKPSEQSLVAGNGISLTSSGNTVTISAEVPTVTGFVTEAQLQTVSGTLQNEIDAVSGAIPELPEEEEVEFEEIDLSDYALVSDIPVVTGFATKADLDTVSGMITPELPVVAGDGIGITETESEITIAVTANFATQSDIAAVTGLSNVYVANLTRESGINVTPNANEIINAANSGKAVFLAINGTAEYFDSSLSSCSVHCVIPLYQISDGYYITFFGYVRFFNFSSGRTYNYQVIVSYSQDNGWDWTFTNCDPTTFATQSWVTSQGFLTSVPSNYVTETELTSVSGTLQTEIETVSATIPELPDEEEVEFEEIDLSDYALVSDIPVVSGFATKTEVNNVSGTLHTEIQTVSGNIPTSINPLITANITDIQVVNSLPGSPVATVLYLIPEV